MSNNKKALTLITILLILASFIALYAIFQPQDQKNITTTTPQAQNDNSKNETREEPKEQIEQNEEKTELSEQWDTYYFEECNASIPVPPSRREPFEQREGANIDWTVLHSKENNSVSVVRLQLLDGDPLAYGGNIARGVRIACKNSNFESSNELFEAKISEINESLPFLIEEFGREGKEYGINEEEYITRFGTDVLKLNYTAPTPAESKTEFDKHYYFLKNNKEYTITVLEEYPESIDEITQVEIDSIFDNIQIEEDNDQPENTLPA